MLMTTPEPIPPFETGAQLVARLAHLIRPKDHLSVSEWAERYIPHYDPMALPFLAEIMDALSDPATSEVGDMGPAQAGKSMVGEAWIGWAIEHNPEPFLMVQPDKAAAEAFVKLRIDQLLASIPVLKAQLAHGDASDNMHLKLFRGMYLGAAWPVKSQFRQRPYCYGWLDDFDAMPDDVEGEGSPIKLLNGRQTSFEGRDTKLISSSPAREVGGIETFIASGTDERLQPVCPDCGSRVELNLRRDLKFDAGTLDEAEQSAHVIAPCCGVEQAPSSKRAYLDSLVDLPNRGFVAANVEASKRRRTFRRDGLLSFTSWGALAREWREAQMAWEDRQDENPLKTFFNVKAGVNYRSQLSGEKPLEAADLLKRREKGWQLGTVPRGPKVLNAVVDVQRDRFEVAIIGTAAGRETWLVDRFAIHVLDDGLTPIMPFLHKEHWKVLLPLFDRKVPMVDMGVTVGHAPILSVTVDTGGSDRKGDQATEGSKFFWQAARALGVAANRITLVKGGSRPNDNKLMPPAEFADQKVKGGRKKTSAKLWRPNVHKIKNILDARLRRAVPGPGYIHLPENLTEEHADEIVAEELVDGKWKSRRARNETWDHLVYAEAAILKPPFAQSRTDMRWIPRGFAILWPNKSDYAEQAAEAAEQPNPASARSEQDQPKIAPVKRPARRTMIKRKRKGDWLGKRRS